MVALPFAALVALNVGGQVKESLRLQEVRGAGLYSDAINRLAADLLARERRPFAYFPDWGLSMPVAFLTGGRIGMDSLENHEAARRTLCADRDVVVAVVNEDRAARIDAWQRALGWDAPTVDAYRQADGKVVFLLATFRGRRDGPGCGDRPAVKHERASRPWHARCRVVAPAKAREPPRRLRALPGTRPGDTGSLPSRGRRFAVTGRGGRFLLAVRQPRAAPAARYASRFVSRRPRATLSRISPHTSDSDASSMSPVASTAVGSRGTRPRRDVLDDDLGAERESRDREQQREAAEERQRAHVAEQARHRAEDAQPVAIRRQLARRAFRPLEVARDDLGGRHAQVQRVHGELRLDLEAARLGGKRLHEPARHHAVAGEHVPGALAEQEPEQAVEHPVAPLMAAAVGGVAVLVVADRRSPRRGRRARGASTISGARVASYVASPSVTM